MRFPKQGWPSPAEHGVRDLDSRWGSGRYVVLRGREEQYLEPIDAGSNAIYCQCLRNSLISNGGISVQSYPTIGVEIAACAGMDARPCVSKPAKVNMEIDGEKSLICVT